MRITILFGHRCSPGKRGFMTSFGYGCGALTQLASQISTSVAFNPDNTSKCISYGKSADRTSGLRRDKLVFDQLSGIRTHRVNTGETLYV